MPSSLRVTLLVALRVLLVVSVSLGPQCDNGKLSLDKDLPASAVYWDCPETLWLGSTQRPLSIIDTLYDPEPARQICMDKSISYNHTIPNSGAFRPVRAESGEYFYCPPQRWLNNLHHAAIVLLYHPCTPLHERLLLSALGRSCLTDYIMTPHKKLNTHTPIVLVSWGRTLELSTSATLDICDWLETTTSTRNKMADLSKSRNYNLFLTWSAETHRKRYAYPKEYPAKDKEFLRQCCEQVIISLLNGVIEPHVHKKKENLKRLKDKGEIRHSRASTRKRRNNMDEDKKENTRCVPKFLSDQTNGTLIGDVQNYSCTTGSLKDLPSENRTHLDMPETAFRIDSFSSGHPKLKKIKHKRQKGIWKHQNVTPKSPKQIPNNFLVSTVNGEDNHTTIPENISISSKDEGGADSNKLRHKDSAKQHIEDNGYHEKSSGKNTTTDDLMDKKAVDVKERELKQQQTLTGFKSVSKSELHSQLYLNQQTASDLPRHRSCGDCNENEHCECTKNSWSKANGTFLYKGFLRITRNDEALWATAALGFLLVLLTLSVLHTRLYRHWRTSPSLYWHDPNQDYDTVADVINRRIQIAKRRLKRGRRKECIFLSSSSSSDEHP